MNKHLAALALLAVASTLAACGGGAAGPSTPAVPASASGGATLSTSATTSVSLPTIATGTSATVTLPAASNATKASLTLTSSLPSGAVAPQAVRRSNSKAPSAIGGTVTPLGYIVLTVSANVSFTSTPAFTFNLFSAPPAGNAYIAFFDVNNAKNGWNVIDGPGTVSGTSISFAAQTLAPPISLVAGDTYVFALVIDSTTVPSPPPNLTGSATYTGTKTVNYTYGYNFGFPAPTGTAPPSTLNYNVSTQVSAGTATFPTTPPTGVTLVDQNVAESDVSNLQTTQYSTDSWIAESSTAVTLYGSLQQEPSSANLPQIATIYGTPQTIDQLPETNGASWTNSPDSTVNYAYANGNVGQRVTTKAGNYTDNEQILSGNGLITWLENADGSGSITGPYFGGGAIASISVTGPTPVPASTPIVTLSYNFVQPPSPNPTVTPHAKPDALWYPWTQGQPIAFYTETDATTTGVALPTTCTGTSYTTANDVKRTITVLDTIVGFIETTTLDSYNVSGVPTCLTTNDVQSFAYDEQGNTPDLVDVGPLGLEVITTNETLVLSNAATATTAAGRAQAARPTVNVATVAAIQAHQLSNFARQRAERTRAFIKRIQGGVK